MNAPLSPAERAALEKYEELNGLLGGPAHSAPDEPSFLAELDALEAANRKKSRIQKIGADEIVPSRFANRLAFNWHGKAFENLMKDIAESQGNTVPVLVRPLSDFSRHTRYELATGHRRHRACLELGLPVLCQVEELTDQELVERMAAENNHRTDLCAYEKGLHYQRLIDAKVYESHTALAKAFRISNSLVSKLIKLAALPKEVVNAFKREDLIRVNWGSPLLTAIEKDPDGVISRAKRLAGGAWAPKETFEELIAIPRVLPSPTSSHWTVKDSKGEVLAVVTVPVEARGEGLQVAFGIGAVCPRELTKILYKMMLDLDEVPEQHLPPKVVG